MSTLSLVLKWLSGGAFLGLGVITLIDWRRHGDRKRAYIAAAVGLLGLVSVSGTALALGPVNDALRSVPLLLRAITAVELVALVLSGYALLLLRDALVPYSGIVKRGLQAIAAVAIALSVATPFPATATTKLSPAVTVAILVIIGFWTFCLGEPALRLWMRSRRLPAVQRARMRSLSAGYGLIVLIIIVAVGAGSAANSLGFQVATEILGLLSVPILYASFAPPAWLRRVWRGKEDAAFARGLRDLLSSTADPSGLAKASVEWASRLVGADGSALVDHDGRVLAMQGVEQHVLDSIDDNNVSPDAGVIVLPLEFEAGRGRLVVKAGAVTPLYGAEEVAQLELYATHVTIALDRSRLIAALRRSEAAANEANEAKSIFLASMSHELRTPMSAILGFSDVLADEIDGPLNTEQHQDVRRIRTAGTHLLSLLDDVLDLSKIEAGKLELSLADVDLAEATLDVLGSLGPVAAKKSLTLGAGRLDGVTVHADRQRIQQILLNLLTNAIKFTEHGGVTVDCEPTYGGLVRITVTDTGMGIPPEAREVIFDEFRQVDSGARRAKGGTGLGLAICRHLVTLHGGTLGCESTVGVGSTFWFTLPVATHERAAATGESPGWVARSMSNGGSTIAQRWGGATGEVVLIIDDDAGTRTLIAKRLHEAGYETAEAASGEEGIRLARRLLPIAITLDLHMPVLGGAEVLTALNDDPITREIPVVLVTIDDRTHIAVPLDHVAYVQKPLDKEMLLNALQSLLQPLATYDVMVIDDDPNIAELVTKSLTSVNATVRHARSGTEGVDMVKARMPDVLFVDLLMPEMSGFEVIARIRALNRDLRVPIIVVTAKDVTAEDARLLNHQIDRLLNKSDLITVDLGATVRQLVARRPVAV